MNEILGNNFLISLAWKANSPTHAANMAQLAGCSAEQIRAVRNAAKLKRDKGEDIFTNEYSPFEIVDVDIKVYKTMFLEISIDKLYEKRGLNGAEYNELAQMIEDSLAGTKFRVKVKRQIHKGHVKA